MMGREEDDQTPGAVSTADTSYHQGFGAPRKPQAAMTKAKQKIVYPNEQSGINSQYCHRDDRGDRGGRFGGLFLGMGLSG